MWEYQVGIRKGNREGSSSLGTSAVTPQAKVSPAGSERKNLLVFQGHIIKGESTGLGKILREVGEKNNYKIIDMLF